VDDSGNIEQVDLQRMKRISDGGKAVKFIGIDFLSNFFDFYFSFFNFSFTSSHILSVFASSPTASPSYQKALKRKSENVPSLEGL
jgi:hypothetical protein